MIQRLEHDSWRTKALKLKSNRVLIILALSFGILVPGINAASANVATSTVRSSSGVVAGSSGQVLCAFKGLGQICVTDKDGSQTDGTRITGSQETLDPDQTWDISFSSHCGGRVSSKNSCPFAPGSGLNAQFNNLPIVTICLAAATSKCMADDNGNVPTLEGPTATGTDWVLDGYSIVNRWDSDSFGSAQYLTSDGTLGDKLFTINFVEGLSQWGSIQN